MNTSAEAAREAARAADGKFSCQARTEPEVSLTTAVTGRTPVEEAFFAGTAKGVYDNDLAGSAVRAAAARLYPGATALAFEANYTDEGEVLTLHSVLGGSSQGVVAGTEQADPVDDIVFTMSGGGNTGEEITGMRHVDDDTFVFELT